MDIATKKLAIIEKLVLINNPVELDKILDSIKMIVSGDSDSIEVAQSNQGSHSVNSTQNVSAEDVKNLDNLIAQNMPELGEALSIDEIRALGAKAEADLQR